jgi:hypothetical protein
MFINETFCVLPVGVGMQVVAHVLTAMNSTWRLLMTL